MKTLITLGIVLSRTNYGEADRIITVLTPDQGKIRLMAKGVRKLKSKLAGGVELFSVSELSYVVGKSEIGTLISARLKTYYGHIVEDMDRVQLGYDLIKMVNRITEDHPEAIYFELLSQAYMGLDDLKINRELIRLWFCAQLLKVNGHMPNLFVDTENRALEAGKSYDFNFEQMGFIYSSKSDFSSKQIKLLRLLFGDHSLQQISKIGDVHQALNGADVLIERISNIYLPQTGIKFA